MLGHPPKNHIRMTCELHLMRDSNVGNEGIAQPRSRSSRTCQILSPSWSNFRGSSSFIICLTSLCSSVIESGRVSLIEHPHVILGHDQSNYGSRQARRKSC